MEKIEERKTSLIEIISAIVIALTTVATAWSAYQSTLWSGIQDFALEAVNAENLAISEKTLLLQQRRMTDGMILLHVGDALIEGKQHIVDFYSERARPELRKALEAWLAEKPLENPKAKPHPLAMPEYEDLVIAPIRSEIAQHQEASGKNLAKAREASTISDNYVLLTVLFASVLFLEALASKFNVPKIRTSILIFAVALFLLVSGFLLTYPVTRG
jgi:hypothetical protein